MTLRAIVRDYRASFQRGARAEVLHYARMKPADAVRVAARALNCRGRRHSHQRRIGRTAIEEGERLLVAALPELRRCRNFEQLLTCVERAVGRVAGLGELYCYDTAHRIGAALGLSPGEVYLHSGTRVGAARLGLDGRRRSLAMSELPCPLGELEPYEVEDVLCIYKSIMATARPSGSKRCG